ncbi:hypothetical protein AGOR_G00225490 [Albula goreensis]|uniref:ENTH domain-containing protein n=1 Tax=Albula goreensis TaxID=1534307 RepID=A0A8T3CP93_9TELE|nr:hypothetical protein AGOR_G00225490 [Albula goreensis]
MMTSSLRRQMKNMVHNYTEAEVKVREATSNDPWCPPTALMSEISDLTFNQTAFPEVMGMIWKRLNDHGKNWRHVYKALTLLEYLIRTGSDNVAQECRDSAITLQTLRDFQYIDRDGKDQGASVREKARQVVALMRDEERLKKERTQALKTRQRTTCSTTRGRSSSGYSDLPPPYPGRRSSQPAMGTQYGGERTRGSSSFSSSFSSPHHSSSDLEHARPQNSGEEELQLQLALAMSREESEKPPPPPDADEQTQLQIALNLSKEEAGQPTPPIPVVMEMDEDTQLQLALSLSKEEHQQEQRSREGDEALLRKALEESRREAQKGGGESAMMDLVDIFGPGPAATPSPWDLTATCAKPDNVVAADPWDSLGDRSITPEIDSSWMGPPAAGGPKKPWGPSPPPPDPWETSRSSPGLNSSNQTWTSPAHTGPAGIDPFCAVTKEFQAPSESPKLTTPRSGSPTDGDLFGEPMMGEQVNGREEGSPEPLDLSCLREGLADPTPRTCQTPESFLGPAAASLVNLDSLIPSNPPAKTNNPFLTGMSDPSPSNPFQNEQPRLTLNQMRSDSPSPLPSSTSLPMSLSHQPPGLPSSFTHPPTFPPSPGSVDLLPSLPQPLLPLSTIPPTGQPGDQQAQNPFL